MNTNKAFVIALFALLFNFNVHSQSVTISPSTAEPGSQMNVTITGNNIKLGQGSSCLQPACVDLGSSLYFSSASSVLSVPYSNLVFYNDTMANATLTVPDVGYYNLATPSSFQFSNGFFAINIPPPTPSISISPSKGETGANLTVTVTGTNTYFGTGSSCAADPKCTDLGSAFFYGQGSGTLIQSLPFTSVSNIDTNHVEVAFNLPYQAGNYSLSTASGRSVSNYLEVYNKPAPSISLSPSSGIENTTLTVTITGNGTKLGIGNSCISPECVDLGEGLFFQVGSSTMAPILFQNLIFNSDTSAEATITLPATGYYQVRTQSGFYYSTPLYVQPKPQPALYISPDAGEVSKLLTVTIIGNNTFVGQGSGCASNPNCTDIGNAFYYTQGSTTQSLPFTSVNVTDTNYVQVSFYAPSQAGYYQLHTSAGVTVSNFLNIYPKPQPTVTISPSQGEENKLLRVTITGNGAKLKKTCAPNTNCIELGSSLFFSSGSSTISVPFSNVSYIDNQNAAVTLKLPNAGYYQVSTINGSDATDYFYVTQKPQPALSISPNSGTTGTSLKVTITGSNITFGKGKKCQLPECVIPGNELLYYGQGSPTTSGTLILDKVKVLDPYHYTATITLPAAGYYSLQANGIAISELLEVYAKPAPSFTITPSAGTEGTKLKVHITGTNVSLGQGKACDKDPGCTNIGTAFQFFGQGSSTLSGSLPFSKVKINDPQNADVTIILPVSGLYRLAIGNSIYSTNYLLVTDRPLSAVSDTSSSRVEPVISGLEDEVSEDNAIKVYPNPTQGIVNVGEHINTLIYNSLGNLVFSGNESLIDITTLSSGIYLMKLTDLKGNTAKVTLRKE